MNDSRVEHAPPSLIKKVIMPIDVSVIITTFNSAGTLGNTLSSIATLPEEESPFEVILVDNHSDDNTISIAQTYPDIAITRLPENTGLAHANNTGARQATGKSILFLNPDTELLPGSLSSLKAFETNHPNAGLLGPAMIDMSGNPQSTARSFPAFSDILFRRTPLGKLSCAKDRVESHLRPVDTSIPAQTDWLVGAALWLTKTGRDKVGLMSDKYFLYFEDVEWCRRMHDAGLDVWLVPESVIKHISRRESSKTFGRAFWHHLHSMAIFYSDYPDMIFRNRNS